MKSTELKNKLFQAQQFVSKLDQYGYMNERGKVVRVGVSSQIYYQASAGSKNYHDSPESFDEAFAQVIKDNFKELAAATLALMEKIYTKERISEKHHLLAQLAEIEKLEAETEEME